MIIAVLWLVNQARRKPGSFVGLDQELMRQHVLSPGNRVLAQSWRLARAVLVRQVQRIWPMEAEQHAVPGPDVK